MIAHRRFHYHASAHALSGELTRPVQHVIEVQAGMALPSTGGSGSSHVENFRFDEVVSFRRAYTQVSGSAKHEREEGREKIIHTTHATAAVEGLNILDVVTAGRIVARLSSSFEEPPPGANPKPTEGKVLLIGSQFENLRIAGHLVDVELDQELFLELGTFSNVREHWKQRDGKLRQMAGEAHGALKRDEKSLPDQLEPDAGMFGSIVKEVHFKEPGFQKRSDKYVPPGIQRLGRHAYYVVDFGKIFLGEILCQHGQKTLTMMRVEFGSPNGGGITVAEGSSNGWPPWD
jgi:hypothetical protein